MSTVLIEQLFKAFYGEPVESDMDVPTDGEILDVLSRNRSAIIADILVRSNFFDPLIKEAVRLTGPERRWFPSPSGTDALAMLKYATDCYYSGRDDGGILMARKFCIALGIDYENEAGQ